MKRQHDATKSVVNDRIDQAIALLTLSMVSCGSGQKSVTEPVELFITPRPSHSVITGKQPPPAATGGPVKVTGGLGPELLTNGDFEEPQFVMGHWEVLPTIPGWQLISGDGIEVQNHVAGDPFSGAQFVELDAHRPTRILQEIPTQPNEYYQFSIAFTARENTTPEDNHLIVRWNNVVVLDVIATTVNPQWRTYQSKLKGKQGTSRLELEDAGVPNGVGTYIDAVSLKQLVP